MILKTANGLAKRQSRPKKEKNQNLKKLLEAQIHLIRTAAAVVVVVLDHHLIVTTTMNPRIVVKMLNHRRIKGEIMNRIGNRQKRRNMLRERKRVGIKIGESLERREVGERKVERGRVGERVVEVGTKRGLKNDTGISLEVRVRRGEINVGLEQGVRKGNQVGDQEAEIIILVNVGQEVAPEIAIGQRKNLAIEVQVVTGVIVTAVKDAEIVVSTLDLVKEVTKRNVTVITTVTNTKTAGHTDDDAVHGTMTMTGTGTDVTNGHVGA